MTKGEVVDIERAIQEKTSAALAPTFANPPVVSISHERFDSDKTTVRVALPLWIQTLATVVSTGPLTVTDYVKRAIGLCDLAQYGSVTCTLLAVYPMLAPYWEKPTPDELLGGHTRPPNEQVKETKIEREKFLLVSWLYSSSSISQVDIECFADGIKDTFAFYLQQDIDDTVSVLFPANVFQAFMCRFFPRIPIKLEELQINVGDARKETIPSEECWLCVRVHGKRLGVSVTGWEHRYNTQQKRGK
jgi:hypothetical protein